MSDPFPVAERQQFMVYKNKYLSSTYGGSRKLCILRRKSPLPTRRHMEELGRVRWSLIFYTWRTSEMVDVRHDE